MPLSKDLKEFAELLNSNGVEYLVVGGFAVSYHGFVRCEYAPKAGVPMSRDAARKVRAPRSYWSDSGVLLRS
jgi:hypothetical protein